MSDLEHLGIERLKAASEMSLQYYGQPLIITDSGGKDSSVVKELALRSGIPFEIMHNHTTAEKLANLLGDKCVCPPSGECAETSGNCDLCWLKWLEKPVEDE